MKTRRLISYWIGFFVFIVILYVLLQILYDVNFWRDIEVSQYLDSFGPYGTILFEIICVIGWSVVIGILTWKLLSRSLVTTQPIARFILEVLFSWVTLVIFEVSLFIIEVIFSMYVRDASFTIPIWIDFNFLVNISWINLILVILFYTFIGFRAWKKNESIDNFVIKTLVDSFQILVMSIEGMMIFIPFDFIPFDLASIILIYGYYSICILVMYEIIWVFNRAINKEREKSQQDFNSKIYFLQICVLLIGYFIFVSFFPSPLFLMTDTPVWGILLVIGVFLVCLVVPFYRLLNRISPNIFNDFEYGFNYLKYHFDKLFALRGTMFNYPEPIDILSERDISKTIEGRWQTVIMKMACGQCYHIFEAQTSKLGSQVKPVPCEFCGSMATTPVWE